MRTVMQSKPQRNDDRQARWGRLERANLFEQYGELRTQGLSQRQAAHQFSEPSGLAFLSRRPKAVIKTPGMR